MSTGLLSSMRRGCAKDGPRKDESIQKPGKKIHTKSTLPEELGLEVVPGREPLGCYSISTLPRTNTQPKFLLSSVSTLRGEFGKLCQVGCRLLRPRPVLVWVAARSDVDESLCAAEVDLTRDREGFTFASRGLDSQREPPTLTTNEKKERTLDFGQPADSHLPGTGRSKLAGPQPKPYSNVLSHSQSLRHILNEKIARPVTLNERDLEKLMAQGRSSHPAKSILKKSTALGRSAALQSGSVRSVGLSQQSGGGSSRRCVTFSRNRLVREYRKNESTDELDKEQ